MPTEHSKSKLYCYVDETGQDTMGKFFIVSVVVTGDQREELIAKLEQIEQRSGKGRAKWIRSRVPARLAYLKQVLSEPLFKHTLHFAFYTQARNYMALTVLATARAVSAVPGRGITAVYVDGLPRPRVQWFGTELRRLSIRTSKVVGVRKEETDPLIRLADACCGFVRSAVIGEDPQMQDMFERAKREGYLREV